MPRESYKFALLRKIFMEKTNGGTAGIGRDIDFTLYDVKVAFGSLEDRPSSISNFVLDLTRKDRGIQKRLPQDIIDYGYDLRKKTGPVEGTNGINYCGTFVYQGKDEHGETIPIQDWLEWGAPDREITVDSSPIPPLVREFISNDEAALFSVIDYCDVLSQVLGTKVYHVQSPMKWQPNEIDGLYAAETARNKILYPAEAKAESTKDDINIVQIYGQFKPWWKNLPGTAIP